MRLLLILSFVGLISSAFCGLTVLKNDRIRRDVGMVPQAKKVDLNVFKVFDGVIDQFKTQFNISDATKTNVTETVITEINKVSKDVEDNYKKVVDDLKKAFDKKGISTKSVDSGVIESFNVVINEFREKFNISAVVRPNATVETIKEEFEQVSQDIVDKYSHVIDELKKKLNESNKVVGKSTVDSEVVEIFKNVVSEFKNKYNIPDLVKANTTETIKERMEQIPQEFKDKYNQVIDELKKKQSSTKSESN